MADQNQIKVNTTRMKTSASALEVKIADVEKVLDDLSKEVNSIMPFWEGEGADAHFSCFNSRINASENYIKTFKDSVKNLRTIIEKEYKPAEKSVKDTNKKLEKNVLSD